ncbi:MAG: CpaE family protein [Vicinamibacterales bacterium]
MTRTLTLVGSKDLSIEEALRASGARVNSIPAEALAALSPAPGRAPDALILDLRGEDALPASLGALKRSHPSIGIVIVAEQHDPVLMLEAMRAGVTEWLAGDIAAADLSAAVERVMGHEPGTMKQPGKVFAFIGAKGGVGTTTAAVNVAVALKKLTSQPAVLLDLHLAYGHASVLLSAEPRFSVVDALENRHRLDSAFFRSLLASTKAGPDLLASSDRPVVGPVDVRGIAEVVDFAARLYPWVVLDVPRTDAMMLDSLELVSQFLVVANQELPTVGSASRIAAALRQRYGRERVEVIVSRYDRSSDIAKEDVARAVGGSVGHLVPNDYRVALQAINLGQPLVLENHSEVASSYTNLARRLAGMPTESAGRSKSGGLLGLFGR